MIALIPSVVLMLVGFAVGGYLIYDAVHGREYATKIRESEAPSIPFFVALQEERRLTLRELAGNKTEHAALVAQRLKTDAASAGVSANLQKFVGDAPDSVQRNIATVGGLFQKLPQTRQLVDSGQIPSLDAFNFYNKILDQFVDGVTGLAQDAPNAENAYQRITAVPLFTAIDQLQRSDALAAAAVTGGGFSDEDYRAYISQIGAYHTQLDASVGRMIPEVKAKYDALIAGDAWRTVQTVENALLRNNQAKLPAAVPEEQWRAAARQVGDTMMSVFVAQSSKATEGAIDEADNTLIASSIAAAAALAIAIAISIIALRLSNRLIGRLARLREDTLDVAEIRMPEIVDRVRSGEDVDLDSEVRLLDHGNDEIGEVAAAFNTAQQTAIAAAVEEAKIREGTKTVFLNIAHRSQIIVHRQLKVLDAAERKQEDPEQLETLFQLDHLSTRARRNAENLIILGGGQPGRRWRNPVSLTELTRGASAETEDFARVKVAKLPNIAVNGPVVGDLVHLLAELIDNATSFSPPEARVDIRGNVVGKGVVLEVEDQGLGIEAGQAEQLNSMLRNPPDFGIMALSTEPRLGLFVVARLAARHGISVTLRESAYGGTRAIVLIRSELLGAVPTDEDDTPPAAEETAVVAPAEQRPELPERRPRHRTEPEHTSRLQPQPEPQYEAVEPAFDAPYEYEPEPEPQRLPEPVMAAAPPRSPEVPPRVDMFRPQQPPTQTMRPVERPVERPAARPPQPPRPPQPTAPAGPGGSMAPGRPPLPQRRRQQNLVPQLQNDAPTEWPEETREESPDQARNRLAAFQRGTRRARDEEFDNDTYGDRT
ncbi:Signal transduction histidine kinase [Amycolatopsis xylanica]|uniref:histidine kinase n=1 Tax=Amycolatopsis xylanica TaxID=589385 RepID=A0A1H3G2C1_9PSEU|nr:nitrate- and nitrite sensing domain-containing protein [Amycolatopsis xylanica]SDX97366.1 Signal transduction histidine kinase [Amycolatopsis xylanica]